MMSINNSQFPYPYATNATGQPFNQPVSSPSSVSGYNASTPMPFSLSANGGTQNLMQLTVSILQMMMSLISQLLQSSAGGPNGGLNPDPSATAGNAGNSGNSGSSGNSGTVGSAGTSGNAGSAGNSGGAGNAGNAGNNDNGGGASNAGSAAPPTPTPSGRSSNGQFSPSPSPTSSHPSASGGSGNPISGGKEGLGVSDTSANGDGSNLGNTKASWYYNWSPNASSKVNDPNATFIPMIWGQKNMNSTDLQAAANSKSPMLLTFNEPDLPGQANMTPQQALSNWSQLEATGKKLSSPAVSNGPDGIKWLDQFMAGASAAGHRVDSISLHWYGSSAQSADQNVASMKDYIDQVHKKYPNMPINLTEFGVDPNGNSAGKDQAFLTGAEKMLNDLPYVQMYSPYGLGTSNGN